MDSELALKLKKQHELMLQVADKKRTKFNDTAAHVLKGALGLVLGNAISITSSVSFASAIKGSITVKYTNPEKPTEEQLKLIEEAANGIIAKNVEILNTEMALEEARKKYGEAVFDEYPPETEMVNVVTIDGCTVNCCKGIHCGKTGELLNFRIMKIKHKPKTSILEIDYACNEGTLHICDFKLFLEVSSKQSKNEVINDAPKSNLEYALHQLLPFLDKNASFDKIKFILNDFQNAAYTQGFQLGKNHH